MDISVIDNIQSEIIVDVEECNIDDDLDGIEPLEQETGIQCFLVEKYSIENLMNYSKRIYYYTGFQDYDHII